MKRRFASDTLLFLFLINDKNRKEINVRVKLTESLFSFLFFFFKLRKERPK